MGAIENLNEDIQKLDEEIDRLEVEKKQLQAENERLRKCIKIRYEEGFITGLREYAWWKDGVQYVGTCGQTLKEAIEQALQGKKGSE